MATIILQLDPAALINRDSDIRYALPDLLVSRSNGLLADDGYGYTNDAPPKLLLFLGTNDPEKAIENIIQVLRAERVLGNDLSAIALAVEDGETFRIVHPPAFQGIFNRPKQ